jgi:hypothetical protein
MNYLLLLLLDVAAAYVRFSDSWFSCVLLLLLPILLPAHWWDLT